MINQQRMLVVIRKESTCVIRQLTKVSISLCNIITILVVANKFHFKSTAVFMFSFRYDCHIGQRISSELLRTFTQEKKEKKGPHVTVTADTLIGPPIYNDSLTYSCICIFSVYYLYLVGYTLHIFCYALNILIFFQCQATNL